MKFLYLNNFRNGFATNSSSTHSVIYKNEDDLLNDLNIFELDYYDRFDQTIAASKEAKIKYIAANIMYNDTLFDLLSKYYPTMNQYRNKIQKEKKNDNGKFGMCCRGELYFTNNENLGANIEFLCNVIDNNDIVIVGGSDETDFVYDIVNKHLEINDPSMIDFNHQSKSLIRNGNYWIGYGWNGKIRFATNKENKCVPYYPELIDLKITNQCEHNCPFCYMNSTKDGQHANLVELKKYISHISNCGKDGYPMHVEFSIGGGNVLLYPHLEELFVYIKDCGHIINTTIKAEDCKKIIESPQLYFLFNNYVNGIGVSVSNIDQLEYVEQLDKKLIRNTYNRKYHQIVIHLIPEYLGVYKTCEIMKKADELELYRCLMLGYKTNGRANQEIPFIFNDDDLYQIFKKSQNLIGIDTSFANRYNHWLKNNFKVDKTITYNEGEYSIYIDGVTGNAYKSSYQLDKPYNLSYNNHEKWYSVIEAFNNIRKDNGFENYLDK